MILHAPQFVTTAKKFDLIVLGLSLLINLVEHCDANKRLLIDARLPVPFKLVNYTGPYTENPGPYTAVGWGPPFDSSPLAEHSLGIYRILASFY